MDIHFDLNTFAILDNCIDDHRYGTNYYGEALINVSANPSFKNIKHFDFNDCVSNMRLVLDNINLTNITAQSTTSSGATLKTSATVKVVAVMQEFCRQEKRIVLKKKFN